MAITTILLIDMDYESILVQMCPQVTQIHPTTLIVPFDCLDILEDLEIPFKRRVIKL